MNETEVLLSRLAAEQLANLPPKTGRAIGYSLIRLAQFPESGPSMFFEGYHYFRQVIVGQHRAIYRYFLETNEVRVYCILHVRRTLPDSEFLMFQMF